MKKIYALLIFLCAFSILGFRQAINIWADDTNQIISQSIDGNVASQFSNVDSTIIINEDLTLSDITITSQANLTHIFQVASNATLTLNNVTFVNNGSISNCYIYNYGKVIINNVSFDSPKTVSDILNDSDTLGCVTLLNVADNQNIKIKLNKNAVYVNEDSRINGTVVLSLNDVDYDSLTDDYIGKVLVKGINTFAGECINHFKFEGAPDESNLGKSSDDKYFANFLNKYYIDYAGILGDSIDNPNDGLTVTYGFEKEFQNTIDSGDIILTKFSVKLNAPANSEEDAIDSLFAVEEGGTKCLYIGGKYATSRLFLQGLIDSDISTNFVAGGRIVDLTNDSHYSAPSFALDNVHSLIPKDNYSYANYGAIDLQKFEIDVTLDGTSSVEYFYASLAGEILVGKDNIPYTSTTLLPICLNEYILQGDIDIDASLNAKTIVSNDTLQLLQITMPTTCSTSVISFSLISEENTIVQIETFVDNTNFVYKKIDYILDNSCKPYYLDDENNKIYLADSEFAVYKIVDDKNVASSGIIDAGNYLIYLNSTNSNIAYTSTPYSITVSPKELELSIGETNFEYDGQAKGISPVILNLCTGDEISLNVTNNDNILPGSYKASISINPDSPSANNYIVKNVDKNCNIFIDKGTITRDKFVLDTEIIDGVETKIVTYDGNLHTINMLSSQVDGITFVSGVSYRDAGEYTIHPTINRNPNLYKSAPQLVIKLIIKPKVIDLSDIQLDDVYHDYDGTNVCLSVSTETLNLLPIEFSKKVTITGDNVKNASEEPYEAHVYFHLRDDLKSSNYQIIGQTKIVNIYIAKIDFDLSLLEFEDKEIEFDGQKHRLEFNNNYQHIVTGNVTGDWITNCGSSKFVLDLTQTDTINYNLLPNQLIAYLTITPKTLDTSSIKFENKTLTYDKDSLYTMSATGFEKLGLSATYTYYVDDELVDFVDVGTNGAGTYRVVASFSCQDIILHNINPVADKEAYLVVNKQEIDYSLISFRNATFTYDKTPHKLDDATSPYNISFTYSISEMTNAGRYTVHAYPNISSQNYTIKNYRDIQAELLINKAKYDMSGIKFNNISTTYDQLPKVAYIQGKLSAGVTCEYTNNEQVNAGNYTAVAHFTIPDEENYEKIADMQCKIIISPKKVTVKLKEDTFVYTGQAVNLEVIIESGILEGDNCTAVALNHNAITHGSYTTGVGLSNSNYTPSKSDLKFTIKKADLDMSQITFDGIEATYDGNPHIPQLLGDVPAGIVPNLVMGTLINAGEYIVYVDFTVVNENYNKPDRITATVVINKKPVLLEFSGLTGLIEDGNKKDITVKFIGTIESDFDEYKKIYSQEPITAGVYTLTVNLNENSNYEILGVNTVKFEILTNSKSYKDDNFQMQIAGEGFSKSAEVSIIPAESNIDEKLQNEGVQSVNFQAFKIVMSDVDEAKNISVTLKTTSINLSSNNIKLFKIKDGDLHELACNVYNNQIVFEASIGDELVIVEEKVPVEINYPLIITLSGVILLAIISSTIVIIKKRKSKKQVDNFIDNA